MVGHPGDTFFVWLGLAFGWLRGGCSVRVRVVPGTRARNRPGQPARRWIAVSGMLTQSGRLRVS
ncbi:hypothetical protein FHR37_000842 [Actinopolymorpha cephalotaxi]|uniref:Uncharacterized protein n=1 Tax=Actinopolymorpha cephalotaxi TaxID=504797 RepID=A0ABX2S132_9ACTN|nr:hypothetical protein [Actinopolymorpha cephalotaxi]